MIHLRILHLQKNLRKKIMVLSTRSIFIYIATLLLLFVLILSLVTFNNVHVKRPRNLKTPHAKICEEQVQGGFPDVVVVSQDQRPFTNQQSRQVAIVTEELRTDAILKSHNHDATKLIFLATPFHGMWSPDHYYALQIGRKSFEAFKCPYKNCEVTNDKRLAKTADAVVFHLRDITIESCQLDRQPKQKWILHTMEPPWLELVSLEHLEGIFNWTMSYRTDSDVVVPYGFVGRRPQDSPETPKVQNLPFFKRKKAGIWFVSDCCTQSRREDYVKTLQRHMQVDVFGGCGRDICRPAETSACYETVMKEYLFYLSFENALCKDYVTEKFFNILSYDVLPVVFGDAAYSEVAPAHSYVNAADFSSPEELARFLNILASNESLYQAYFTWKEKYAVYMSPWTCDLCKKLHLNSTAETVKRDLKKWYVEDAQCRTWTEDGYVTKPTPVFPCYKKKIF